MEVYFFGGGISDDEGPVEGAARETREELGIKADPSNFDLLGELQLRKDRLVYVVKYRQTVEWKDITIQEGAGAGYFKSVFIVFHHFLFNCNQLSNILPNLIN